jgi:uncharacterized protein YbjT (DUF2867 family)
MLFGVISATRRRDERKIAHLGPEVRRVIGDRHEPAVVQRALQDVEKVFLLSGPFDIDHEADRLLTIKTQGKVFNPTGDGKFAPISPYDIAAIAALALISSGHEEKAYDLTGSQLLSTHDQVHTLSKVIGSPIECVDIPAEVAAERMKASGLPEVVIQGLRDRWIRTRNGEATFYANEAERLTGHPAQTFERTSPKVTPAFHCSPWTSTKDNVHLDKSASGCIPCDH